MGNDICQFKNICDAVYKNGRDSSCLNPDQKWVMANISYARSAGLCSCYDQSNLPDDFKCDIKDPLSKEILNFDEQKKSELKDINALLNENHDSISSAYAIKMLGAYESSLF